MPVSGMAFQNTDNLTVFYQQKIHITVRCQAKPPVVCGFPSQIASKTESSFEP